MEEGRLEALERARERATTRSERDGGGRGSGARERARDCLGMSARSHARRACAAGFGPRRVPLCHPTQVIGHPLPAGRFALSYHGASGVSSVLVAPRRVVPSVIRARTVASFTSSSHSPVSLSPSFSLGDLFSVAAPLCPLASGPLALHSSRRLSLPPDIRIDSSAARSRPPFFLSATFFLRTPRPRTIFISTTCLALRGAAWRGAARRFTVRLGGGV